VLSLFLPPPFLSLPLLSPPSSLSFICLTSSPPLLSFPRLSPSSSFPLPSLMLLYLPLVSYTGLVRHNTVKAEYTVRCPAMASPRVCLPPPPSPSPLLPPPPSSLPLRSFSSFSVTLSYKVRQVVL
jgi:hypothetical protein